MKNFRNKALVLSLLAVFGAGLIPFASYAWGRMGQNQNYTHYVTAQYWCGSYYSSYPCQEQYQQYQQYPQYQPTTYSYSNTQYTYSGYQNVPTSNYYYPTTYSNQNLTGSYNYSGYTANTNSWMNQPTYQNYGMYNNYNTGNYNNGYSYYGW